MWYNHLLDSNTRWLSALDPMSYHGGCDVTKGEKWVANIWINIVGDGKQDFRAWKMGSNWLAHRERNRDVLGALEVEIPQKPTLNNRYTKEKNTLKEKSASVELKNTEQQERREAEKVEERAEKLTEKITEELTETKTEETGTESELPPSSQSDPENEVVVEPRGPEVELRGTPAPLPLNEEQVTDRPQGPEASVLTASMLEGNRILHSVMLLIEELDQVELEILARNLHTRLKLVCVPLMVNPMGKL